MIIIRGGKHSRALSYQNHTHAGHHEPEHEATFIQALPAARSRPRALQRRVGRFRARERTETIENPG